jgi:hypothetical protein
MSKIYYYKLVVDSGGAPCVQEGLLSLAICKPRIRSTAQKGDVIFGFAANSLHKDNRLIYAARITDKLLDGLYYKSSQYSKRADCIYELKKGHYFWKNNAKHHGKKADLQHDLGNFPEYSRTQVLISNNFRYFGKNGSDDYKSFKSIKVAIETLGVGHRVHHDLNLTEDFQALEKWVWQQEPIGIPSSRAYRYSCHRSRGVGELLSTI